MTSQGLKGLSTLTKVLIGVVVILAVVVIVLGVLLIVRRKDNDNSITKYCTSDDCIKSASRIISSIDKTTDPCDDFYQYACGSWIKDNSLPDRLLWDTFNELDQQISIILKRELEIPISANSSKAEQKAKMLYSSCMDANKTIETLGAEPMLQFLDNIGGWGISNRTFNISAWTLQKAVETLVIDYNGMGLIQWQLDAIEKGNSTAYGFQIFPGAITLSSAMYLNSTAYNNITTAYLNYMTQIGKLLEGVNDTTEQMQQVIDFETKIANITQGNVMRDEPHQMTIAQLQTVAPFISWKDFFSHAAQLGGKQITDQENIDVYNPEYLSNLTSIINDIQPTTPEGKNTLNNYLVWQTIQRLFDYMSKDFRDAKKDLQKAISGTQGQDKSWKNCVRSADAAFGFVLGKMYVDVQFPGDSKTKALAMIEKIRTAFEERLSGISWLDQATIALAKEKADAITDMIGYPDYIMDNDQLDEQYKDLEVNESRYFQNMVNYEQINIRKLLNQLDNPENKTRWLMTPQTVNAYYQPSLNQIVFPAAILQKPFYDKSQSQSLNFGGIGMVVGHEITHGFDNTGRQYDKDGIKHQWWSNATIQKFNNQTECMVNQYNNYEIDGIHLNGQNTLGENIADNGGIKEAYQAYADWTRDNGEELPIMGLNFTHKQLLFLGFAQNWCTVITDSVIQLLVSIDVHSISKFRVNGPLSNFKEFATEFNCPSGSRMNPVKMCQVW